MAEMRSLGGGVVTDQQPSELALRVTRRLKELRCNKAELALQIGCSRSMVSQYLAGKYKSDPATIETALIIWRRDMSNLKYTPEYKPEMKEWDIDTTDLYENWNEAHRQFLGNDAAIVQMIADLGLSVVDGKLCVTYEEE